ncbi:MAG: glycosyltransferase family 4 protein, partial [Anaerolineae bacterium]|nr:glycosyltransferase family 4 protein [Anaerolineae bacterium]
REKPVFIFHEHDSIRLDQWYYRYLIKAVFKAGKVVAVSDYIKSVLTAYGDEQKIYVVKNAIDPAFFKPEVDSVRKLPLPPAWNETDWIVGFASRLVQYKGWEYVLELASVLNNNKVKFLIAGDGADFESFQSQIKLRGLEEHIHLLGYVDQMDLFYHSIDLLVVTTQKEAFGLVQLEAQASGVPVVVFDTPASREIQGDQSLILVPNQDIKTLSGKILELINHEDFYTKIKERGLKNSQKYTLKQYITQIEEIYSGI